MSKRQNRTLRAAQMSLASVVAVLSFVACATDTTEAPVDDSADLQQNLAACSYSVTTNTYEGDPEYWGTLKIKNTGRRALKKPTVTFKVPSGVKCDYHESGWTHTQRGTTCTYTRTSSVSVDRSESFTLHFSTDSTSSFTAAGIALSDPSCSSGGSSDGGSSGGGSSGGGDSGAVWRRASVTHFESYPDPGSEECIEYNGCTWAGQFAALDGKKAESWVREHNIVAVHSKDFAKYKLKTLRLRKNGREIDARVYDMCSDSDCDGCCTRNAQPSGFLIDVEKYTAERFGAPTEGEVEWRCLDCN